MVVASTTPLRSTMLARPVSSASEARLRASDGSCSVDIRPRSTKRPPISAKARVKLMAATRSEEHTSELQSLMRTSYAVFCLKKKNEAGQRKGDRKDTTNRDENT